MRYFTILFFLIIFSSLNAQEKLKYTNVIHIEGASKDELFNRAYNWFVNSYRSANNVIQINDKQNGQITAKSLFNYNPNFFVGSGPVKGYIRYTVSIYVKDGRFKYEITDFIHDPSTGPNSKSVGLLTDEIDYPGEEKRGANQKWMNNTWHDIKQQIHTNITPIVTSIIDGMNITSESSSDDW